MASNSLVSSRVGHLDVCQRQSRGVSDHATLWIRPRVNHFSPGFHLNAKRVVGAQLDDSRRFVLDGAYYFTGCRRE